MMLMINDGEILHNIKPSTFFQNVSIQIFEFEIYVLYAQIAFYQMVHTRAFLKVCSISAVKCRNYLFIYDNHIILMGSHYFHMKTYVKSRNH